MTQPEERNFYVGYRDDNPSEQGRFTRKVASGLLIFGLIVATLMAALMQRFDPGVFEFGEERVLTGRVRLAPQPVLELSQPLVRPTAVPPGEPYREVLLVNLGKYGARASVAALDGQEVSATGTLIAQDRHAMFELSHVPEATSTAPARTAPAPTGELSSSLGGKQVDLIGEIVDSKCFLGVMKPGRGKAHKSCAALCLEGGVPPAFLVRDDRRPDEPWVALLLDAKGEPIKESLRGWVGVPVAVSGQLQAPDDGSSAQLWIDVGSLARL